MFALPFFISIVEMLFGPQDATIVFAGDAMQHKPQVDAALQADGTYSYSECFADIADYVKSADYAVVNLETTLGASNYSGYPCFCSPDSYAEALKDAGFDMMLGANNHTLDRRDRGLVRTIDVLDDIGVDHIGTYRNAAERDSVLPKIVDIRGFKVGFLDYTYGTNGIRIQGDVVVDYIDRATIAADIKRTRDKGAELLCVLMHWGNEYQMLPCAEQKSLANFLIEQGVDLIIGGHPHVIQPMEVRHSDVTDKDVLLVYSLGNFISNQQRTDTRGGVMVKARIVRDEKGNARFDSAEYLPVFTVPGRAGGKNYRLVPAENCTDHTWAPTCRTFLKNAHAIFDKHNRGVPPSTFYSNP